MAERNDPIPGEVPERPSGGRQAARRTTKAMEVSACQAPGHRTARLVRGSEWRPWFSSHACSVQQAAKVALRADVPVSKRAGVTRFRHLRPQPVHALHTRACKRPSRIDTEGQRRMPTTTRASCVSGRGARQPDEAQLECCGDGYAGAT